MVPRGRNRRGEIDYLALSFTELDAEVDAWCRRLTACGVRPGDRTLVMVRQGLPLIAAAFALFRIGAVPVIIDPGMGLRSFLSCVGRSRPRVLLGIPLAQFISHIFRRSFGSVAIRVPVSRSMTFRLGTAPAAGLSPVAAAPSAPADLAAILFTSGSTGSPKGVCYEHRMLDAQVSLVRDTYGIEPGEIDLPLLPVFALFDPALGMTAVVPEIDPSRPASVDPSRLVQAILQENITNCFGSPTLWRKIGDHCLARAIRLPTLRRVLCAGAPVPASLWADAPRFLPNGKLHSPYGATEALPVSTVSADQINPAAICGACVGRPLKANSVKIIAIADHPIASLAEARELPPGEIGEIIVSGPSVTRLYDQLPEATAAAKIRGEPGSPASIWHRMGDSGFLDPDGLLWFCGRVSERIETAAGPMFTEPCEQIFRAHPAVRRCALVGIGDRGRQTPAIVVELKRGISFGPAAGKQELSSGLRQLARVHRHTASIETFYIHPRFPVDVRHNAKIHRLELALWAATAQPLPAPAG